MLFAQQRDTGPQSSAFSNNLDTFGIQLANKVFTSNTLDDVKGNYYLFDTWKNSTTTLKLNGKNVTIKVPCNYNLVSKEIEVKINTGEVYALNISNLVNLNANSLNFTISDLFDKPVLVQLIGSSTDLFYYIKKFDIEVQNVRTTTLGLYENKFKIKESEFIVNNNTLYKYKNKNLKKLYNSHKNKKISTRNKIIDNLNLLNN